MKRKQLVALCLTAALVISSLAGCGKAETSTAGQDETQTEEAGEPAETASEPAEEAGEQEATGDKPYEGTQLTFWMQPYGEDPSIQTATLDKITAEFYEKTGITVNYTINDWGSAMQKLTLASTGGEAPDVSDLFFTSAFVAMSSDEYGIMEVNDLVEDMGGEAAYLSAGKDEAYIDGNWYGVPWRLDTRMMLYNTEDFEKAGITEIPKTWDELIEVSKQLTETNDNGDITHAGLSLLNNMGRYDQVWTVMLAQAGGEMMNADFTEFTFDSEEGRKALKFLSDVVNEYNISNNSVDASYDALSEFMSGKTSIVFGAGPDSKVSILEAAPQMEGKFASAPLPLATGADNEKYTVAASAPISIFKSTEHPEAAKEWVKFFCSPENQLLLSKELLMLNTSAEVMADAYFTEDPWLSVLAESAARAQSLDMPLPTWGQIASWPDGPLPKMCSEVVNGGDMDAAIAKCLEEIEKIGLK